MLLIGGVTKLVPEASMLPPEATLYQFSVLPTLPVAPRVTLPASQRLPGVVAVTVGTVFTVASTAVLGETQVPLVA